MTDGVRPAAPRPNAAKSGRAKVAPQGTALRFLTTNPGKVAELRQLLNPRDVVQDARGYPEIQAATLSEVTEAGADHLLATGCLAPFILEDSGLFVTALNGFPGVYSRHALDTLGPAGILRLLAGYPSHERGAWFETDLLLVDSDQRRHHFTGRVEGQIHATEAGSGGFGFDSIFRPHQSSRTFAEMGDAKNDVSHRALATRALVAHLNRNAA